MAPYTAALVLWCAAAAAAAVATPRSYTAYPDHFCSGGAVLFDGDLPTAACQARCDQLLCACFCALPGGTGGGGNQGSCRLKNGTGVKVEHSAEGYTAFLPKGGPIPPPPPAPPTPPAPPASKLWLTYRPISAKAQSWYPFAQLLCANASRVGTQGQAQAAPSPVLVSACGEAQRGLSQLLGRSVAVVSAVSQPALVLELKGVQEALAQHPPPLTAASRADEAFTLSNREINGQPCLVVTATAPAGILYGTFRALELMRLEEPREAVPRTETPALQLRMWDLWDNQDGSVERGYAGRSVFDWESLPTLLPRYTDYARILASVGINGIILNNVNACGSGNQWMLTSTSLRRLAPLINLFGAWGIRAGMSPCFGAPITVGNLSTADPIDAAVIQFWHAKAAEIRALTPNFFFFLVKSDTEGAPGPARYNRTELEGATMLADALAPIGGLAIWRAFTHPPGGTAALGKQPSFQFDLYHPFNGRTRPNLVLQVKNGPYDFQVREPVHALFGRMTSSSVMVEVQATQEYTGQARHLVSLVGQWKSYFSFDLTGDNDTLAKTLSAPSPAFQGAAAVSNLGNDPSWTGHPLSALNTFGYGRLAWDPSLTEEAITRAWVASTFGGANATVVDALVGAAMSSWEAYENYTSPLGVGFVCDFSHYKMDPKVRQSTLNASATHVGYNHSGFATLFNGTAGADLADPNRCPEDLLLFYHNVPHGHVLRTKGNLSVIDYIYQSHAAGAATAAAYVRLWASLEASIDPAVFQDVQAHLQTGAKDAAVFADAITAFFRSLTAAR